MMIQKSLLALCAGLAFAGAALAADPGAPAMVADGMLVGPNSMTLYTFDKDPAGAGKSLCNGPCAKNWPPLTATAGASASGEWSLLKRDDGSEQWAYKGKPVYYWTKDAKPGDRSGDGFNGVWHVAKP